MVNRPPVWLSRPGRVIYDVTQPFSSMSSWRQIQVMDPADEDLPPDLQKLVRRHGGYSAIAPQIWRKWDRANADWQARRRFGYGPATGRGKAYPRIISTD